MYDFLWKKYNEKANIPKPPCLLLKQFFRGNWCDSTITCFSSLYIEALLSYGVFLFNFLKKQCIINIFRRCSLKNSHYKASEQAHSETISITPNFI